MSRKEPITEDALLWEIHKATIKTERTGKRYDEAVSALSTLVKSMQSMYPERWKAVYDAEMAKVKTIEEINKKYEERKAMEGSK